jgi:hypothetical protein
MQRMIDHIKRRATIGQVIVLGMVCYCLIGCKRKEDLVKQAASPDSILVSLQLVETSPIPDPAKSDYADCLYAAEAKVLEVRSQTSLDSSIILMLPAFAKRTLCPEASFKTGQVIDVEIIPQGKANERLRTMQRSDSLTRFDLPLYHVLSAQCSERTAESFASRTNDHSVSEAKGSKSDQPALVKYPSSPKAAREREAVMARDKATIQKALNDNGGDWERWYIHLHDFYYDLRNQVDASPEDCLLKGQHYFKQLVYRKYKILCQETDSGDPGPLKMLTSLNAQLRARGIDLIVVPFPTKEDVNADIFSSKAPADGWFQPYRQKFLLQLMEADIEVIDLIQPLRAARDRFPFVFYDEDDQHPADGAIQVTAEEIAKRLERYDLLEGVQPLNLQLKRAEVEKTSKRGTFKYSATRVVTTDGKPLTVPENAGSPVIIMGDSYTRIPHEYLPGGDGCALPMHLSHRLGRMPDQLVRMGGSSQAMRLLAREGGDYLAQRRVLIFVFAHTRLFGNVAKNIRHSEDEWDMVSLPPLPLDK